MTETPHRQPLHDAWNSTRTFFNVLVNDESTTAEMLEARARCVDAWVELRKVARALWTGGAP